ncbi:PilW family protein [Amphritea spongicola]|nr:PilW family protein [Aliamphritea spongicola]
MIELMVSMLIGLIIMGAVLQVFLSSNQSYRIQEAQSRIQEDGRAAIHFISQDIRGADFWGCTQDKSMLTSQLDAGNTHYYQTAIHDFIGNPAVFGVDSSGASGSDSLTLRGATNNGSNLVAAGMANPSSRVVINDDIDLSPYQVVLVSDCLSGDIFQTRNATRGAVDLSHGSGVAVNAAGPGNAQPSLSKAYDSSAEVFALQNISYTIDISEGQPTLRRNDVDLVPNVEDMQLLFGVDTNGDFSANYYVAASNVASTDWDKVVSVRVSFLIRSREDNLTASAQTFNFNGQSRTAADYGDKRLRNVFTTTVSVRNRGG